MPFYPCVDIYTLPPMQKELKQIIRATILEGQIERSRLTVQQVIDRFKGRVMIFFDTETTGLDPKAYYALITEIAALAIDTSTGEELGSYSMKSKLTRQVKSRMDWEDRQAKKGQWNPKKKSVADLLQMTGYHEGDVPYDEEAKVIQGYIDFINSFSAKNPVLVAHNAKFDMYQIGKAIEAHGIKRPERYSVLDTNTLAGNYLLPMIASLENLRSTDPEIDSLLSNLHNGIRWVKNLGALGKGFNVQTKHWHSAIADAHQLAGITSAIINFFEKRQNNGGSVEAGKKIMAGKSKEKARATRARDKAKPAVAAAVHPASEEPSV